MQVPDPRNEPALTYAPGTPERMELQSALQHAAKSRSYLPLIIDGRRVETTRRVEVRMPHRHRHVLADVAQASTEQALEAATAALRARDSWARTPFADRAAIFLKAAHLLAGPWRMRLNAATMLGQSKTAHQAEIDAACELTDFWRFNVAFAAQIMAEQPLSTAGSWNRLDYRPLDGFVLAITPFNFTSIAGNLPTAPALLGNTVVWKPATTAALSAHVIMELLMEAGLPAGVINLVHAPGSVIGNTLVTHPDLGGIHFTGSSQTFQGMWQQVGANISRYRCYPRLVGETGGKDFIIAHESADLSALTVAIVRGAFEYQGQKCSAVSRVYCPQRLWPELAARLDAELTRLCVGDVADFQNFLGAVIDARAFESIRGYIQKARGNEGMRVLFGGDSDDSEGYFIRPTVVVTDNPKCTLMREEIFGPVVTIFPYPDDAGAFREALTLCNESTPYALTGAVFAQDRSAVREASLALRFAAGNFYINDKPTGAIVGQQPFGGSRASGTNDKAGSKLNLLRWVSARAIKETFVPATEVAYPFMK